MRIDKVVRLGVKSVVAKKFKGGSVIAVRAGSGGHVDLSGLAPELRRIDPGLDLELLQRVHRRQHDVQVEIDVGIRDAVESVVGPRRPSAGQ
jgi:hypothetical protein